MKNGVKILTETAPFPTTIHLGVLLELGTRDETPEISGSLLALKKTYLRTHSRSTEEQNYCTIQMSGGEFLMDYDQEKTYFHGNCLAHDTYDFLQMMSDSVFDPKLQEDDQEIQRRLEEHRKVVEETPEKLLSNLLLPTAYGLNGLGLPLDGSNNNLTNISHTTLNEFRKNIIVPNKIIVCGAGVYNHHEFVSAVKPYFENLEAAKEPVDRVQSTYLGGEIRHEIVNEMTHMSLSFKGVPWDDPEMPIYQVLRTVIGEGGGFSTGGPGKGMHARAYNTFLRRYPFLESVKCTNQHFTDTGIFSVALSGLESYSSHMSDAIIKELIDLQRMTDLEITRAKNLLKNQALLTLEKTGQRLEDAVKMYMVFGKTPDEFSYIKLIDDVTPAQVRDLAKRLIKTRPTLVIVGSKTESIPGLDQIQTRLS